MATLKGNNHLEAPQNPFLGPYVVARMDIGFSTCLIARFAQAPHDRHYQVLKGVCKYLRQTIDWGIYYWRRQCSQNLSGVFRIG